MQKRRPRRHQIQLAFDSITIEGGLLSPEWLSKIGQQQAPGQLDIDYRVPKGLNLRDEIGRYWRMAQALWAEFRVGMSPSADLSALADHFVVALLRDVFGFGAISLTPLATDAAPSNVRFAVPQRVPIAITAPSEPLDTPSNRFIEGSRKRSAFGQIQEYLNSEAGAVWGIAANGIRFRLLRENSSLTRPAWIEADLERMFTEERYADFVLLWLLIHETRFGNVSAPIDDCWLEVWRNAGRQEGVRARDQLRDGVESALVVLGQGFLSHQENAELRLQLERGALTTHEYFAQLLRLIYRIIFLLTLEERDLLHPPDAAAKSKQLYTEAYSLRSLRERSVKRMARDRFDDLWQSLRIVFRGVATGEKILGLPALGGLFADDQCRVLDTSKIQNSALLEAIFRLSWLRETTGLSRVNWRDMGPEEFGSIYESLLELIPETSLADRRFSFASTAEAAGNTRKLTSSFYTHDVLVQTLLDSSIEPLIDRTIAQNPKNPADALLCLTVIDPACGSGHFLLGAARRLAVRIAHSRTGATPSVSEYREALREVIAHCIYGVDRNPMAVELCRTALWLEGVVPGRPLSFLDAHIRCGDALLGIFDLGVLEAGIPDAAFSFRDGDDKNVASILRRKNKQRVKGLTDLPLFSSVAESMHDIDQLPDESLADIAAKRSAMLAVEADARVVATKLRCDLFCSAFFSRKVEANADSVPLTSDIDNLRIGRAARPMAIEYARSLAVQHNFFHWPLAFPEISARGGFDVVLGNPPWKPMSPDAKEWFAPYDPEVRALAPVDQEKRIKELLALPGMQQAWGAYCQSLYDASIFMRESGRYKMFAAGNLGAGDLNVYRMFVETALNAVRKGGVSAQFVPENLYNGANAGAIRASIFGEFRLALLLGFQNTRNIWFPSVYHRTKFCLYVAERTPPGLAFRAAFGINTLAKLQAVRAGRTITYPLDQVKEFNPETLSVPEIAHPNDIAIVTKLYAVLPKFGISEPTLSERLYCREIDMGNDREDFQSDVLGIPVYEGRMVDAFDHRAKAYVSGRARSAIWKELPFGSHEKAVIPQWRIEQTAMPSRIGDRWLHYRVGFCDVASSTNARTLVAALIPSGAVCGHKVPTITFTPEDGRLAVLWLGVANAICVDYLARKKVSLSMSFNIVDTLPLPRTFTGSKLEIAIAGRALRLTATGPEMDEFWNATAPALGIDSETEKPCEEPAVRERLRSELDVLVARDMFGLTRDEMRYLLDPADILGADCDFETFGPLRRNEEKKCGEFRTRRLILETWDSLPRVRTDEPVAAAL